MNDDTSREEPVPNPAGDASTRSVALLVLGMHRSGTSALTRVLNLLGADLPGRLMPPVPGNNELGFWESEPLKELHEKLLRSMDSGWSSVREIDLHGQKAGLLEEFRGDLRRLLEEEFSASRLFVVKDPRVSRLLPLWLPVLEDLGAAPRFLLMLRNPLEVAASLARRDRFSTERSLLLWLRYMLEAERETRGQGRAVVVYADLLADWQAVMDGIGRQLDLQWPRDPGAAAGEVTGFLSVQQRHHEISDTALAQAPQVSEWIRIAYSCFTDLARQPADPGAQRRLDALACTLEAADSTWGVVLRETEHSLREAESERDRRGMELEQAAREQERTTRKLEDTTRILQETSARLETITAHAVQLQEMSRRQADYIGVIKPRMDKLEAAVRQRDRALALAHAKMQQLAATLHAIESSRAWRLLQRMRRGADLASLAWLALRLLGRRTASLRELRPQYLRAYQDLRRSGLFQPGYYLRENPDVAAEGCDPLWHFLRHGAHEGRRPNPVFDPLWYAMHYPDVGRSGINPLLHYVRHGAAEGREPAAGFDTGWYLVRCPQARRSGKGALAHYLEYGAAAGISAEPPQAAPAAQEAGDRSDMGVAGVRHIAGRAAAMPATGAARPLSVLVVGHASRAPIFGAERSLVDVIRALHGAGHIVHAAFPHDNPDYFDGILDHVHSISVFPYRWWRKGQSLDEEAVARFAGVLREVRADVVHANTIMLREPLEAARRAGVAAVVHVREIISQDEYLTDYIGLASDAIVAEVNQRADYLVANSDAALACFGGADRGYRIYNAVDVHALDLPNEVASRVIRVGLISSNIPKKGLVDFVRLAALAERRLPALRFVLIGPVNRNIENLGEVAGLERLPANLEIAGYAESPVSALAQVNVVMNLSTFGESFGRTVAEAMAARRPVIVYDHGALPELVRPGVDGFVIPFRDYEAALQPLSDLCAEPGRIPAMGEQARARALERFAPEALDAAIRSVYGEIQVEVSRQRKARLRIAYFNWHFPVPSETFVLNELRVLHEEGHELHAFCRQIPNPDFHPDFPISITRVNSPEDLAQRLKEFRADVVHGHFVYPTITEMVWPAAEAAGVPFTFIAHAQDIFRHANDAQNRLGEVGRSPMCLAVFAPSRFHRDFFVERGVPPDRIIINPNGIDPSRYGVDQPLCRRAAARRVCAVHRFVEKKGLENLIRAAKLIEDDGIAVDIYGYGPLEESYRLLAAELGAANVRLEGPVDSLERLLAVLRSADAFLCPSVRAADGDMDGIPTVVMEAMAAGTPVIASAVSGIPELVVDGVTGVICTPDPAGIAAAIRRLYAMPAGRLDRIRSAAKARVVRDYNARKLTANLVRVWRRDTVDIVLVSWNNLPELREVVRRIRQYTTWPYRLIICDNASGEETRNWLTALSGEDDPRMTILFNDRNAMVGPGTNLAMQHGSSEFVIYVCAKEGFVLDYNWELAFIRCLEENPDAALAGTLGYSPSYLYGRDFDKGHPSFAEFRNREFAHRYPEREFRHVQGGLFAMRRAAMERLGGFSDVVNHNGTDVELSFYVESSGWKLAQADNTLSLYIKTRPYLEARFDESVRSAHPPRLAELPVLDAIVARRRHLCPLCGWTGAAFDQRHEDDLCPACGCTGDDRTLWRFLSESTLTYRRLPALAVGLDGRMRAAWEQQFRGQALSVAELGDMSGRGERFAHKDGGLAVIYGGALLSFLDAGRAEAAFREFARLLRRDGGLLLLQDDPEQYRRCLEPETAGSGQIFHRAGGAPFKVSARHNYDSFACRFGWRELLVLEHMPQ